MNRQVTIYSFDEVSGFRSEVRRQHSEILYGTGHHESAAGALEDARAWMEENGFALGPYRVATGGDRLADSPRPPRGGLPGVRHDVGAPVLLAHVPIGG
jgi:hypothetical protein